MRVYEYSPGTAPLLVTMPHAGSFIPESLQARMSGVGKASTDTDWGLERLYDFLAAQGVGTLRANYSRYVIDLSRDPDGRQLHPRHPRLVPTESIDGAPLYLPGQEPTAEEINLRRERYWRPYHEHLARGLMELKERFPAVVVFDCHSIRSVVPRYMSGRIPDLNLGTADGTSCSGSLREALMSLLERSGSYSVAVDGVFKGGYITRHYGMPAQNQHAFQLELSQAVYMQEASPPVVDDALATALRPLLLALTRTAINWAQSQ